MFRILTSFILFTFLFIGIISTANMFFTLDEQSEKGLKVHVTNIESSRITIKEIDKVSANNNYRFTLKNSLR